MRLWSLDPEYLDVKGLLAVWREGLLAKNVLENKTKGYKNHPQLIRFKKTSDPIRSINIYLNYIYKEAKKRGYNFDNSKIKVYELSEKIIVTNGQILYEKEHLLRKLKERDIEKHDKILKLKEKLKIIEIFKEIDGDVETWEKISK